MPSCPSCGAEYRADFERCRDCDVPLVASLAPPEKAVAPEGDLSPVFSTGRRVDAELVRSMLEGHGLNAHVWAAGMGPWRMESALTEMTGVPSAFNSYRVMVPSDQVEDAEALLADVDAKDAETDAQDDDSDPGSPRSLMGMMRSRWVLVGAALFLLAIVVLFGAPGYD